MNSEHKIELLGIPPDKLGARFELHGERAFRAKQICKWLYSRNITDFNSMTDLPTTFREFLRENALFSLPQVIAVVQDDDGTAKFLFELVDGKRVEAVFIPDDEREKNTICVSSQVGCAMGCTICATGAMGFTRNLSSTEIIGQVVEVKRFLESSGRQLTNVVFMGMGEPLANLDSVCDAIRVLLSDYCFGLGHRKILISTVGLIEGIDALIATELKPKLAISLSAPTDELRAKIMPTAKKYSIEELCKAAVRYAEHNRRWVTFEYVLIDGFNDDIECAKKLTELIKDLPVKVNLIPLNPIYNSTFVPAPNRIILRFQAFLLANAITATVRFSKGSSLQGACGQLAAVQN